MPVLYALIVVFHVGYGGSAATRIATYENLDNCLKQSAVVQQYLETQSRPGNGVAFCIPTN